MPPTYGYKPPRYGTGQAYRSPQSLDYQRLYGAPDPWSRENVLGRTMIGERDDTLQLFRPPARQQQPPAQAPAEAPPNTQPQQPGQQQPQAPPGVAYDWSTDPVFQKIQALGVAQREGAQDEAGRLRKETAIRFGDPNLARSATGDEATALAAEQNPFSVEAILRKDLEDQTREIDLGANRNNLFFSGARARALGEATRGYQGRRQGAFEDVQGMFGDIGSRLLAALSGADYADIDAEQGARDRGLGFALENRIDPGAQVEEPLDPEGNLADLGLGPLATALLGDSGSVLDESALGILGNVEPESPKTNPRRRVGGYFRAL